MNFKGKSYVDSKMPMIGLGTWQVNREKDIHEVLDAALGAGYRFIDTAQVYKNEAFIGASLKELLPKHKLNREDIFITTKLAPGNQGSEKCEKSLLQSLADLQTDYIDLMLIHWPGGGSGVKHEDAKNKELRHESWHVMEKMFEAKTLRSIGVSNFNVSHLKDLLSVAKISPAVNQCEYHPHYYQPELVEYCKKANIHFQAYSSLGSESNKAELQSDKRVIDMAAKYKVSVPIFLLTWAICQGMSVLPRSRNPDHVRENLQAANVKISEEDIEAVKNPKLAKYCWNPDQVV